MRAVLLEVGGETLPAILRGPERGPTLLVLQPWFEELNRTRRTLACVTELLAGRGVRSLLPDLPGSGDHGEPASAVRLPRWRGAVAALGEMLASDGSLSVLAVRAGMLVADAVEAPTYAVAPVASGAGVLRALWRTRAAAGPDVTASALDAASLGGATIEVSGYPITPGLAADLRGASALSAPGRLVEFGRQLPFAPPWASADAADDTAAFARWLANDIADWMQG